MCFCASASFVAAGALAGVGIVSWHQTTAARQRMFASIPLLFAVQQAAEGLVWVTFGIGAYAQLHQIAAYLFLLFAVVIWPLWVPLSLWFAEREAGARVLLGIMIIAGGLVALYATGVLYTYPLAVEAVGKSVRYDLGMPPTSSLEKLLFFYSVPTIVPFFISSLPWAKLFGSALLLFLLFTYAVKQATLISVWCFFAALISVIVVFILRAERLKK